MRVEVLYIDSCPNHPESVQRVKAVLEEFNVTTDVIEVPVADSESALALHFLGSPTIRVNGVDIEPSARQRTTFGMMCRTYGSSGGVPPEDLIRKAIKDAESRS